MEKKRVSNILHHFEAYLNMEKLDEMNAICVFLFVKEDTKDTYFFISAIICDDHRSNQQYHFEIDTNIHNHLKMFLFTLYTHLFFFRMWTPNHRNNENEMYFS